MFDIEFAPQLTDQEIEALTATEFAQFDDGADERQWIPDDLDKWVPGPHLGVVLSSIDSSRLSGHDSVKVLKARSRQVAHEQAGYYSSLGDVATAIPHDPDGFDRSDEWFEYANMEVRAALTLTRRAADSELGNAQVFLKRLPQVWQALNNGSIDVRKALTVAHGTNHLAEGDARQVADCVLPDAQDLTTGQLRACIRRLCIEVNPKDAEERSKSAVEERRMIITPTVDGTGDIHGYGAPIDRAAAIGRRINTLARGLKTSLETRTMDQLRMDVFLDLLEGHHEDASMGKVVIHADLKTLAELSDTPGELAGYAPVIADIPRQVADRQRDATWEFVVTDESGQVTGTGTTRRRPSAALKREILARYPTCVAPGCRMPATECDIDHRDPYAEGGKTTLENNAPLCRHDHVTRHEAGWTYIRLPDGRHQWTSPLGHVYVTGEKPP